MQRQSAGGLSEKTAFTESQGDRGAIVKCFIASSWYLLDWYALRVSPGVALDLGAMNAESKGLEG